MDKSRVHVETTIPSFYHETRTTPDIVARRDWTRRWWAGATGRHELVTSEAVLDELGDGPIAVNLRINLKTHRDLRRDCGSMRRGGPRGTSSGNPGPGPWGRSGVTVPLIPAF